jgi:hypothetical protein
MTRFLLVTCFLFNIAFAKDNMGPCAVDFKRPACLKLIKQNLLENKDNKLLITILNKYGYKVLFTPLDRGGDNVMKLLPFIGKLELFKNFSRNADILATITNDQNLYDYFFSIYKNAKFDSLFFSKDEVQLLFTLLNSREESLLVYAWGNEKYPSVYHNVFKKYLKTLLQVSDSSTAGYGVSDEMKETAAIILKKLNRVEVFSKKTCNIINIDHLNHLETLYGDFYKHKSQRGLLVNCLLKKKKYKLLEKVIDSLEMSTAELSSFSKLLWNQKTKDVLALFQVIVRKMEITSLDKNLFKSKKLNKYIRFVVNKKECLQLDLESKLRLSKAINKECDEVLFQEILDRLKLASKSYKAKGSDWINYLSVIVEIYKAGFPYDFSDENGDTLTHHLVRLNHRDLVIYIEQQLNSKKKHLSYIKANLDGETPLHLAIKNSNWPLINDYTKELSYSDAARFPYKAVDKLMKLKNRYKEKNSDLIMRAPAKSRDDNILKFQIYERIKEY